MIMSLAPGTQLLLGWLIVALVMLVLWLIQRRTRNAGIVDVGWASGIGVLGVLFAVTADGWLNRRILVGVLVGAWSARLAIYLLLDRVAGRPEEGRYRTLRQKWAAAADRNLFVFFQAQALLDVLFALPILIVAHHRAPQWTGWDMAGVLIWIVAVGNTVLADHQLARFRRRPENRGKTCRDGWWQYSRHPNYFFEWLHWWSYVALAVGAGYWWVTLLAPAVMLFFLFKVTGIPPTEAQALASRGEEYREYQRTTSVFIPWFPKRGNER
jgi:steroid 5-alpha reductase family enzyme